MFSIIRLRAGSKHCNFLEKEYWIGVFSMSFLMQATTSFFFLISYHRGSYFLPLQLISDQIPTLLPHVKISYLFPTFLLPWPPWNLSTYLSLSNSLPQCNHEHIQSDNLHCVQSSFQSGLHSCTDAHIPCQTFLVDNHCLGVG